MPPPKCFPAYAIKRADRMTLKPTGVYSQRRLLPAAPQNTKPDAMPMDGIRSMPRSLSSISIADLTHRMPSSSWNIDGMPKTILNRIPLSSDRSRTIIPPY
eukprot:362099_1